MVAIKLTDLNDSAIRDIAAAMQIAITGSPPPSKDQLITAIKNKTPPDQVLVFVQYNPSPKRPWYSHFLAAIPSIAVLATVGLTCWVALANQSSATTAS